MTRIIKYMHVFFIILAVIVLNAHMIIQHDHHQAESSSCQESKCPISGNCTNHHKGFPAHCHAFNDLASEKAATFFIIKQFQCRDFVPGSVPVNTILDTQLSWIIIFDAFKQPVHSGLPELSSLRAPPVSG